MVEWYSGNGMRSGRKKVRVVGMAGVVKWSEW